MEELSKLDNEFYRKRKDYFTQTSMNEIDTKAYIYDANFNIDFHTDILDEF